MPPGGVQTTDEHGWPTERIAGLALASFAALLPFQAIAGWSAADSIRFPPCDWVVIAGFPWLALSIWRARVGVVASWIVRGWIAFALAGTLSAVANARGVSELARVWAPVVVVASVVAVSQRRPAAVRSIVAAAIGGGWVALAIGWIGYAGSAAGLLPRIRGDLPFTFQGPHPLFDDFLRFAGTFGLSCQSMGDYLLVWLALLSRSSSRPQRHVGLWIGSLSVAMTFASSWVGLPLVVLASIGWFRPPVARAAVFGTLALSLAASWIINVGLPVVHPQPHGECAGRDSYHYVTHFLDRHRQSCEQILVERPYPSLQTTYQHAKEVAWNAFEDAPLFGIGPGRFRNAAQTEVDLHFGKRGAVTFYTQPHSDVFGVLAERGATGLVAFALLIVALLRSQRGEDPNDAYRAAVLALLFIGINADLLHQRFAWLLTAVMASARNQNS